MERYTYQFVNRNEPVFTCTDSSLDKATVQLTSQLNLPAKSFAVSFEEYYMMAVIIIYTGSRVSPKIIARYGVKWNRFA